MLEPLLAGVAIAKRAQEIGVSLPLAAVAKCDGSVKAVCLKVLICLLDIVPVIREGIEAGILPCSLVINNNGAGAAGQNRKSVNLVAILEGCEIVLIVIIIIRRILDDIGHIQNQSLCSPGLGIHALKKEYVRKIVCSCHRSDLRLVLSVSQNVLVQSNVRMSLFPVCNHGTESIRTAVSFRLLGGAVMHQVDLARICKSLTVSLFSLFGLCCSFLFCCSLLSSCCFCGSVRCRSIRRTRRAASCENACHHGRSK